MASYYYNAHSGKSFLSQWADFIQNESYVNDIRGSMEKQTSDYNAFVNSQGKDQAKAINESTTAICGTLEKGFNQVTEQLADVNWRLNEMNESLDKLHSMLDWKTDLIIESQKITNTFLGNMALLLKIPDSQKQRAYYVENGLVYLKNAINEGSKSAYYDDAVAEFHQAESIEKRDFFTLNRLGLIYMHSLKYLNIEKAKEYFLSSARYAKAFAEAQAVNTQTILREAPGQDYKNLFSKESLLLEASNSLIYASRCCYILQQISEAKTYAEEAFKISPSNAEAGFQLAKMLTASNALSMAASVIDKVITIDRYYSLKVVLEQDLISKAEIRSRLDEISSKTLNEAKKGFYECRNNSDPIESKYLSAVQIALSSNDFLGAKKALDLLFESREWDIIYYSYNQDSNQLIQDHKKITETLHGVIQKKLVERVHRNSIKNLIEKKIAADQEEKKQKIKRNWMISMCVTLAVLILAGLFGIGYGYTFFEGILKLLKVILIAVGVILILGIVVMLRDT